MGFIVARASEDLFKSHHPFGVVGGEVIGFAGVTLQVIELQGFANFRAKTFPFPFSRRLLGAPFVKLPVEMVVSIGLCQADPLPIEGESVDAAWLGESSTLSQGW